MTSHLSLPHFLNPDILLQLAREARLVVRTPRKLHPVNFLISCLLAISSGRCSLRCQAIQAGLFGGAITLSKQALHKRMGDASARFLTSVLARLLSARLKVNENHPGPFERVLVQDSTCLGLTKSQLALFPGASNAQGRSASVRIQSVVDLLSERFLAFSISAYTRNDQAASGDILPLLRAGDLVLRDLGYFCISVLQQIAQAGAHFITRWQPGTFLLDPASGKKINLLRLLKRRRPLDIQVLLGKNDQMPARLLAFPLPKHIADERRRKALSDRDGRSNHSKEFLALLSWGLFLTNADQKLLPPTQAAQLYRLRWRIEILFKSWKSNLGLSNLSLVGTHQIKTLLCAQLILALLLQHSLPVAHGSFSILKLSQFFSLFLLPFAFVSSAPSQLLSALTDQLRRHCTYEKRNRPNYHSLKTSSLS